MTLPAPLVRGAAAGSVAALLVAGLVTLGPAAAPAAHADAPAHLPAAAQTFTVSQTTQGRSGDAYLTSDGQHVAFASDAADLAAGDTNGVADIFLSTALPGSKSPYSGAAVLVSAPDASLEQVPANGVSSQPVASTDGRYVAFTSAATNLVTGASAPGTQVYVRDVLLGRTFRVQGAAVPDGSSYGPDLSDNGRYLVFTSEATNLSAGDTNAAPDGFFVDLDANGDGTYGDMTITRVLPDLVVPGGVTQTVLSGNGNVVVFTAGVAGLESGGAPGPVTGSFVYHFDRAWNRTYAISDGHDPAVDSTGDVVAYIKDTGCDNDPSDGVAEPFVAVSTLAGASFLPDTLVTIAVGTVLVGKNLGYVAHPTVSADGGTVAWETTQPFFDLASPPTAPLAQPVVRTQAPSWWDAKPGLECSGILSDRWVDVGNGTDPTLSASGRTIAYSVPSSTPGGASIVATDTHSNSGLSVSSTQGELVQPGYVTSIDTSKVPASQLTQYASALANAPIYRLPIYRLPIYRLPIYRLPIYRLMVSDAPIYRLPIYRLPIYRLPIYRLAVPGGWTELLASTPFAGQLEQSVTLSEVLDWAAATLAPGAAPPPSAAQLDAARRIQGLSLDDMDLTNSGIDALSLASMVLGGAHLAEIPIAGSGTNIQRWQALIDAQGLGAHKNPDGTDAAGFVVDGQTVLADVDAAGLDIGRTGVEAVALNALPVQDTLFDQLKVSDLFLAGTPLGAVDVASLSTEAQAALFTSPVSGTLADNKSAINTAATVADLALGAPTAVTLGTLLFSILDTPSYPWEQIDPASIQSAVSGSTQENPTTNSRILPGAYFRFTFDPGPGDATTFTSPTATITMPPQSASGHYFAIGSGPQQSWTLYHTYAGPLQVDGDRITLPLDDTQAGTVFGFLAYSTLTTLPSDGQATATLTSGALSASKSLTLTRDLAALDDPTSTRVNGQWADPNRPGELLQEGSVYYGWIAPAYIRNDDNTGARVFGPAGDENWYRVAAPPAGKRLIVSTNASDGQISMALYAPSTGTATAPLGADGAGSVPGTLVTEQTAASVGTAESGADAGAQVAGQTLIDQAVASGDGLATVESAGMDAAPGDELLIRVTSGNGQPSSAMYSLRVSYVDEPTEVVCTARPPAQAAAGVSDSITAVTNTLYLMDTQRFTDTYGPTDALAVRTALGSMTGNGEVGSGTVQGAMLSVDSDAAVRGARDDLDRNPCSMTARAKLTAAINHYVGQTISAQRDHIKSIVIVGGDDMIPLAPVAQHTSQFNEASHAASLRLTTAPGNTPCPATVNAGENDPCATPISAAAATNHILTDDPYGLATAYQSLGGYLYVPNVALGRLVETPAQIEGAISRFNDSKGLIDANSTLSGGYGAWSELPDQVTANLKWRSDTNNELAAPWGKSVTESALFPGGQSPRIISLNTHADESQMLSGVSGAENGVFTPSDLLNAGDYTGTADQQQLAGALLFMIGCHAGNNLPTAYYGKDTDWVDVFSGAAGFVGNTGYGLANNVTTALGERLLSLYADWVGVSVNGAPISAGTSLQYAKQSYLGELGLYSGYDEKALMEAVYYGLPMYTPKATGKEKDAPLPAIPDIGPVLTTTDPLTSADYSSAGLSFSLPSDSFIEHTAKNDEGQDVKYFTVGTQAPLAVSGQPVLPKIVSQLPSAPAGMTPRGALITGLTSVSSNLLPAIASSTVGVGDASAARTGAAFPSTFATVTTQDTPSGIVNNLVVTPGRVQTTVGGQGTMEKFTKLDLDVVYGPSNATDTTPPAFTTIEPPTDGGSGFFVTADGTGSTITKMLLLVQPESQAGGSWTAYPMTLSGSTWGANISETGAVRWILQAADAAGNVAIDSARGKIGVAVAGPADAAGAPAKPTLSTTGGDVHLIAGDRLLRTVTITDAPASELTAAYTVTDANGQKVGGDAAALTIGDDGNARATVDMFARTPGQYKVALDVCRASICSTATFALTVDPTNTAPSASVELTGDSSTIYPTSTLTAHAAGTDPDPADTVALSYEWFRNGVSLQKSGPTLDLHGLAQPGDLISVTVTPSDGKISGHDAFAQVEVHAEPAAPTISATATNAGGSYAAGAWSRSAVTVTFTCDSGLTVASCPAPQIVSDDTTADGIAITGTVTDSGGRTANTSLLVRVDHTAPLLAPTVTPSTVNVGAPAPVVDPHASDAASGIGTPSCSQPDTSTAGTKSITCMVTDQAGNTATASAAYTVVNPAPAGPTITAKATVGAAPYAEGTWTRGPVTVTFTCASDVPVVQCSPAVTRSQDTGSAGVVVIGTVKDAQNRTAQVRFLVKVDRTPPTLAPSVTPATVAVGGTAIASANAKDAGSGVAAQSCDVPDTTTIGTRAVTCRATDAAGNSATATVTYKVVTSLPVTCGGVADRTALAPVNADGSSVFLRMSAVPVLFRACDASGKPIGTAGFITGVTLVSSAPLAAKAKVNELIYPMIGTGYATLLQTWHTSIPTTGLAAGKSYTYRVALADGTSFTVVFGVR